MTILNYLYFRIFLINQAQQLLKNPRNLLWARDLPDDSLIIDKKEIDSFYEPYHFVLPGFILNRRYNAKLFTNLMKDHKDLIIQQEIDCSSWFSFSLIIKSGSKLTRENLMNQLSTLGFEYRPILTGNFKK